MMLDKVKCAGRSYILNYFKNHLYWSLATLWSNYSLEIHYQRFTRMHDKAILSDRKILLKKVK